MNPYAMLSSAVGTIDAMALSTRLSAWHDAMVAHERRLRLGTTSDGCDDECPHAEASTIWAEAVATFGARAQELTFLRSGAQPWGPTRSTPASEEPLSEVADKRSRRTRVTRAIASMN